MNQLLPVCMIHWIMSFASATMVPANMPLSTARLDTSAIRYICYQDLCTWEKYCDHRSQRCENCSNRLSKCFTPAQDANCTAFCMKRRPCPALPQLEHGVHNGSDRLEYWFGDKVTFQCSRGYHNSGQQDTVCLDFGDWSHTNLGALQQPFCQVNLCEFPRAPDHGRFEFPRKTTEFQVGFQIAFGCADGFGPIGGNTTITCLPDGSWDGILPKCIANRCNIPHTPLNGRIVYSVNITNNSVGTEISYTCNEGYKLIGQTSRRCMSGGQWNEQPPVCVANSCNIPRNPPNGGVDFPDKITNFGAGTKVTYSCNNGYALMGQSSRECLPTGQWNVNSCKPPVAPVNGGVVFPADLKGFIIGTEITHICIDGFEMRGEPKQRCLGNGDWGGEVPVCIEKKWYKEYGTWIGLGSCILIIVIIVAVKWCVLNRRQRTTTKYSYKKVKDVDMTQLCEVSTPDSVPGMTISSETVDIKEEGKRVQSLRQINESPPDKVILPRHDSVPSPVTPETPVSIADDDSASTKSPDKVQHTNNEVARAQTIQTYVIATTCVIGDNNNAINHGVASACSHDETDSLSTMDPTVNAVEETSKEASKRMESKPMDDTVSFGGGRDAEEILIAQETECDHFDSTTRCYDTVI